MAKKEYDKVADALEQVAMTGYGIVNPQLSDITFDEPELFRHGHNFGVRLKASAPSIHLVRANIETEVTPFVGNERQGEELVRYLSQVFEEDPSRLWIPTSSVGPSRSWCRMGLPANYTACRKMPNSSCRTP